MIKVETAYNMEEMRAYTYIWIPGMTWQVPEEIDRIVLKVEVFGDELLLPGITEIPDSEIVRNDHGFVLERVWYGERARDVSRFMRKLTTQ